MAALALFVLLLVVGWKFAHANADEVRLDLLFGAFEGVKVWWLAVASFAVGALVAVAACFVEMTRLGLLSRRYRKAITRLEAELHGLRALPLSPEASATAERSGAARTGRDL
jgi:uncharacterized integral membrane protein